MYNNNLLRQKLSAGEITIGTRLWSTQSVFVEALGSTGLYDYAEFEAEYCPYTLYDLQNFCIAAELHGLGSMIKLDFQGRGYWAQKAIGSGFNAINFVDCRIAEEVREAIRLTMPETPQDKGAFGFPNNRFIGFHPWVAQDVQAARVRDVVRCFMIEKASSVQQIEEICSVPGVDMIQFGPSDFSMSSGFNAKDYSSEIKDAERHCISVALAHGIRPRVEIQTVEEAKPYLELGVKDFCYGDQMKQMVRDWTNEGQALKAKISEER